MAVIMCSLPFVTLKKYIEIWEIFLAQLDEKIDDTIVQFSSTLSS